MKGNFYGHQDLVLSWYRSLLGMLVSSNQLHHVRLQTESREIAQTEITVTLVHGQFRLALRQSEISMHPTGSTMLKWR